MKTLKTKPNLQRKTKFLFLGSFVSILLGLSLFLCGILLAFFVDDSLFYLMAFGGLPLLWLGSFLWRTARHIPSEDALSTLSGSLTCGIVDVPKKEEKNH